MSYATSKPIEIKEAFSGGWVTNTPDSFLADKFSPYMINARLNGMATESRPGHTLFATLTAGDYPRGIDSYLRVNPANDVLIVRHNTDATHKLYTITEAGVATSIVTAGNIASDNKMSFQNVNDVVYCMNGVDQMGKLSATTYSLVTTGLAFGFRPAFSVIFNSSMWCAGFDPTGSIGANVVYKSVGDNYDNYNSAGADSFTFSETITGLSANNQAIFYFTKNTISVTGVSDIQDIGGSINYTTRTLQTKEGAVNHYSIVNAGTEIYFLTSSNAICQIARGQNVNGYEVVDLGARKYAGINNYLDTLDNDQTDSFGYYLPKENIIKWFLKSQGSTFNDVCIIYDTIKNAFLLDTNKYFYDGVFFKGYNYTISMIEPKVYIDEYGYDDEDSAIEFIYETKNMDFGIPTQKKECWESVSYVAINRLAELKQEIIIDGNVVDTKIIDSDNIPVSSTGIGTHAIGTYAIGTGGATGEDEMYNVDIIRTKGNLQVKGKKIKYRFTNTTLAGRVRLEHIQPRIEVLPMIASDLTV